MAQQSRGRLTSVKRQQLLIYLTLQLSGENNVVMMDWDKGREAGKKNERIHDTHDDLHPQST